MTAVMADASHGRSLATVPNLSDAAYGVAPPLGGAAMIGAY